MIEKARFYGDESQLEEYTDLLQVLNDQPSILGSNLKKRLSKANLQVDASTIVDDQEYESESVKQMLTHILPVQALGNINFTSPSTLYYFDGNVPKRLLCADQTLNSIMERLENGFCFDPVAIVRMIESVQNPTLYNSRDIFEYLSSCQNQKRAETQQNQKLNIRPGFSKQQSSSFTSLSLPSNASFIFRPQHQIQDGIFQQPTSPNQTLGLLCYKYYSSEYIQVQIEKCGWNTGLRYPFSVQELCDRMNSQKQYIRAAAIALFHFDFERCLEDLNRIPEKDNELKWLCIALKGIVNQKFNSPEFQKLLQTPKYLEVNENPVIKFKFVQAMKNLEICQSGLSEKEFRNPYYKLMAKFIINDRFPEYLKQTSCDKRISIFDRVGLWSRFLSKDEIHQLVLPESIDSIILYGKCARSVSSLQDYIDATGDIQLGGVVAAHLYFLDYPNQQQLYQIFESYLSLLKMLEKYEIRAQLLCEVQKLESQFQKPFIQEGIKRMHWTDLACTQCQKSLLQANIEQYKRSQPKGRNNPQNDNPQTIACPMCSKYLPKCNVCGANCKLPNMQEPDKRRLPQQQKLQKAVQQPKEQGLVWCLSCNHGGHMAHIADWFSKYSKCCQVDCSCECDKL